MEEFERMIYHEKVAYLVKNLRNLPDCLAIQGVKILSEAGETEYAVVLARDKGLIDDAIKILVGAGDYLWAGLIAKNAGRPEESEKLYREGMEYYIDMELFGRAVSAATALMLPPDEVYAIYRRGVEAESKCMDIPHSRNLIESAMESLEISLIGRDDDEISRQIMSAMIEEREKRAKELSEEDQASQDQSNIPDETPRDR